jgi:simple sugar transport system permease protein
VQIALEGFMLVGSLAAAIVAYATGSAWLGLIAGAIAGSFLAGIKGFFVLNLKSDQIVTGAAINLLAFGIAPFVTKILYNSTGSSPGLSLEARFSIAPPFLAIFLILWIWYWFHKTRSGLWLQFSGEAPNALEASGVSVLHTKWKSLLLCGALAGIGGATLSTYLSSAYSPNMTSGRGFIALAALIFGRWRPLPTAGACLLFGLTEAIQIRMQGSTSLVPVQLIQILPYVFTIIALAGFFGNSKAPKHLGK